MKTNEILLMRSDRNPLDNSPFINRATLLAKGLTESDLDTIEGMLGGAMDLASAVNPFTVSDNTLVNLGVTPEQIADMGFNLPKFLGFTDIEINKASDVIWRTMTLEGAPHLRESHYAGIRLRQSLWNERVRYIHHSGHIRMMAVAQCFISQVQFPRPSISRTAWTARLLEMPT